MTWKSEPIKPNKPNPKNKLIQPEDLAASGSEDGSQAALFCWAGLNKDKYTQLEWLHAIPNGGFRNKSEAGKLVATGSRSGVWDIFLPYPNVTIGAHGLYIEMKIEARRNHKNGGLTNEQLKFGQYAESNGYYCAVCYTWMEARDVIVNYLEGKL